mgnify:CR=1 FL=1
MRSRRLTYFLTGLLLSALGTSMVATAQTPSDREHQLVIRSDGFIFLIQSGVRHLVVPISLTDDEIGSYPEGEPYLNGLAPAEAALEVASASKPSPARRRAEPTSHGLGMRKMPARSCSARKRRALSVCETPIQTSFLTGEHAWLLLLGQKIGRAHV